MNCLFPECPKPVYIKKAQLCKPHYNQQRYNGVLKPLTKQNKGKTCRISGCRNITYIYKHQLCEVHYRRFKESGRDELIYEECSVKWCDKLVKSRGMCSGHNSTMDLYNLSAERLKEMLDNPECAICGATGKVSIDHDHSCCSGRKSCGKCVRGTLCTLCNNRVAVEERRRADPELQVVYAYISDTRHRRDFVISP